MSLLLSRLACERERGDRVIGLVLAIACSALTDSEVMITRNVSQ
jgi:hypothetical protein